MNKTKDLNGYTSNNTFWNRKKNEWYNYHKQEAGDEMPYGWSHKELSDALGYTVGALQSWFSGRVVPGEKACEDICNFFDIDPEQGMACFEKDHADYVKAHNNTNQVTIEDVMNDSVPDDFLTWNKRDKAVYIFNVLAANKNINMFHISSLLRFMIEDGLSNAYVVTMSLGRLYSKTNLTTVEYNDMYETLRPYILAEKGETSG